MKSLEESLKIKTFESEQSKANVNILFTSNWLSHKINSKLKPFHLSSEQFNVLRILRGSSPKYLCQKDILERMIANQSNMTALIKKLIQKDFIVLQKSLEDKREYMISITERGLSILKEVDSILEKENLFINNLSSSEAFHLNALLDKIRT